MISGEINPNRFPKNWAWHVECQCPGSQPRGFNAGGYALTRRAALRRMDKTVLSHLKGVHDESKETRHSVEWTLYFDHITPTRAAEIETQLLNIICDLPFGHGVCEDEWVMAGGRYTKTTYLDEESQEAAYNE